MVRQTAEGLGADDVRHVFVNQLQHFRGQEPALAGLIAHGYNVGGHIGHFVDVAGRVKVDALCKGLGGGLPKPFHGLDTGPGYPRARALFAQVVRLELAVLKACLLYTSCPISAGIPCIYKMAGVYLRDCRRELTCISFTPII